MSIEAIFEKKPHMDVIIDPGQVLMPLQIEASKDKKVTKKIAKKATKKKIKKKRK